MSYFIFSDVIGNHSIHDSVKTMSYEQLESTFKGKLDYVKLAAQLGIKPTKNTKAESDKKTDEKKPESQK